jgi:hypothetical protein
MSRLYWRGTNIASSRFRFWLYLLVVPNEVRNAWYVADCAQRAALDKLREEVARERSHANAMTRKYNDAFLDGYRAAQGERSN